MNGVADGTVGIEHVCERANTEQDRGHIMNMTLKLAILSALGLAGPLLSQAGLALDAAAATDSDALTTIVVTAEKREEPLKDVPMSVTALSGISLDELQHRDFSDYAAMVPGLSWVSSQPGLTRLTLRGENAGGVGSTVAVYLDESPFGSSSALLNGSILSGDFDTWDLQRIEVLRGPQGTLYGANSEGGLLKFVTTAPILGSFSGAAEATAESVDHGGTGWDTRAVVNLPVGDKVAWRISGFEQNVPGYIDDPSRGKSDLNGGHKEGGRVSMLAVPTDDLTIRLTATSQQSNYDGTPAIDIDPVTLKPLHGDLTQERFVSEPSSFNYVNYNATVNWNAGPFSILSTTSYGILNSDTFSDASNQLLAPGLTVQDLLGLAVGPNLGASLDDVVDMKKFTQEIRLSSPTSDRLEWQVGGYFTRETGALIEHLNAIDTTSGADAGLPSLEIPIIASTYKEWAGFGNLTYHFNSQFDIQAGGRYSSNEQTASENVTGLLVPTPEVFNFPSKGHVFTYSVAPRWHIDANTMVYARVATGYRPGGPNALPPLAPPDVPREYGADKTTNIELGIRSTQLDGLLSIDVAAFHVDWKNIQLIEAIGGFNFNGNGGTARSQGVEWTFGYIPVHGLTFTWTGAYTDAKLTTDAPGVNGVSGDPLPYAPKWGTSLDGEYSWAAFSNYKGFIGATWSYVGARSTDFGSSIDTIPTQVALSSYSSFAARIGLESDRYRVTLYGKNLGDSRGITSYQSSGAPDSGGEITVIQPRTVGVTLSAKF
jgi:outer membrane receptor protein involved in Fe transport